MKGLSPIMFLVSGLRSFELKREPGLAGRRNSLKVYKSVHRTDRVFSTVLYTLNPAQNVGFQLVKLSRAAQFENLTSFLLSPGCITSDNNG